MRTFVVIAGVAAALLAGSAPAQTLTTLYSFSGPDGAAPAGVILHAGKLYGATLTGGAGGLGTVFDFDLASKRETTLYSFQGGADGASPLTGVVYYGGTVYGTTSQAGRFGTGTVYAVTVATGRLTTLYNFSHPLDAEPNGLALWSDILFGTTRQNGNAGQGVIFAIDLKNSKPDVLHKFRSLRGGRTPASPVVASENALLGTTLAGGKSCGQSGCGTIYLLDTDTERFSVLHRLTPGEGQAPSGTLAEHDNTLYGTMMQNGGGSTGAVFAYNIGSDTLVSYLVGAAPVFGVAYARGQVYGSHGGQNDDAGALFDVDLNSGVVKDVYTFSGGADGRSPGPVVFRNSLLYGVTAAGGSNGAGTLFSFAP